MLKPAPGEGYQLPIRGAQEHFPQATVVWRCVADEALVYVGRTFCIAPLYLDTKTGEYYTEFNELRPLADPSLFK